MVKTNKNKLEELLLERGLAESLVVARGLIMAGKVVVDEQRQDKPSFLVSDTSSVRIKERSIFVSRAGDKLAGLIEGLALGKYFENAVVLDAGASTGGFTQCAIKFGAKEVYAVDVGTNQLAWELRQDKRIHSIEKMNILDFEPPSDVDIQIVTADLSFTSTANIVSHLCKIAPNALFLILVKPQYEIARYEVPDGGVVVDHDMRQKAVTRVQTAFEESGLSNIIKRDSDLAGRTGNKEIFLCACRNSIQTGDHE
jgi:23S rRNA (cytidine1920-2'-O)/16S rRNA (cytidine1409-2'-O)-methyltransferase